jgi:hypothetical protein
VASSLALASWMVTSYPSQLGYYFLAFLLYVALRRERTDVREALRELACVAIAPVLIAGVHLAPALALVPRLTRSHALALADTFRGSLHATQLHSILLSSLGTQPSVFDTPDITLRNLSVGVTGCALVLLALARPTRGRLLAAGAALTCVDLVLGPRSLLMPLLHRVSPLSARSYYPAVEFGTLLAFLLLTLAMDGCADLLARPPPLRRRVIALALLLVPWLVFVLWSRRYYTPTDDWRLRIYYAPAILYALAWAASLLARRQAVAIALLLAGACGDAYVTTRANVRVVYGTVRAELVRAGEQHYHDTTRAFFGKLLSRWPRRADWPRITVDNVVEGERSDWGYDSTVLAVSDEAMRDPDAHARLLAAAPAFVDSGACTVALVEYGPNRIVYAADCATPARVAWSELDVPGWSLRVDGERRPLETAHRFLRAASLPAGAHRCELAYRPPGLYAGLVASALGVALLVVARRRQRRA